MEKFDLAKIVIVLILLGAAIYVFTAPQQTTSKERAMERINHDGKIDVCYIVYPPTVIKDPNTGKLSGEMIDAIEYIANESGWKIDYTETSWGTFIAALQSKKCDVVVTGLFSKIERAKSVAFTMPIFYLHNSVVIKKGDTRFQTLDDFNKPGIRIAVIQGESGDLYAQKHLQNAEVTVLPGSDTSLAPAQVSAGKADAAFTDGYVVQQYVKEHPETQDFLDVNPDASYAMNPVTWAVRQDDQDLLDFINTAFYGIEADGKFLEWEKQYDAHWLRQPFVLRKS